MDLFVSVEAVQSTQKIVERIVCPIVDKLIVVEDCRAHDMYVFLPGIVET